MHPVLRRVGCVIGVAALIGCASGSAQPGSSRPGTQSFSTSGCPLPPDAVGYPVTVTALDGVPLDSAWLAQWARAVAHRWQVPSRRRAAHANYRRVRARVLPDAPRWADDWAPDSRHRAELVITIQQDRVGPMEVRAKSGDAIFDRSLASIIDDPMPAAPEWPALPTGVPSPVRLQVGLGIEPEPGDRGAVVRFARQQRPVRIIPGTLRVAGRAGDRAVVKYDVNVQGGMVPGTFELLAGGSGGFAREVESGLMAARFTPAQGDCVPVRLTVVQSFGQ